MDASNFKIVRVFGNDIDLVFDTSSAFFSRGVRTLPDGNWSIICCSATATEEEAGKVVHRELKPNSWTKWRYQNYEWNWGLPQFFDTATESLASLIRGRGLDDKLNWLFLKLD
jgi:hypothetical protein